MKTRENEPVIVSMSKSEVDNKCHDGRLPPVVGVHNYQVLRANRTRPQDRNHRCYTHNHQPMLTYWNDRFYLQYIGSLHNEHEERTETFLTCSEDGRRWDEPQVVFPAIEYMVWRYSIAHQRAGFYQAPNGRLLTLSFYGMPREGDDMRLPNTGYGIGRAVREIREDGSYGPIYFFRYMPKCGYTEENTSHWHPHYSKSADKGFVEACDALYEDKLFHQQMWEEDRNNDDGYFGIHWDDSVYATGKALSYWTNPDGTITGIWKGANASVTRDGGKSWSTPAFLPSIHKNTAKYWGQQTPDGRYALFYSASETRARTPLAVVTGEDGQTFGDMCVVHGDVPPQRFWGWHREHGPQYVRGIVEGNSAPPGSHVWVAYSVNKEDIWVSRIPSPLISRTISAVDDDFSEGESDVFDRWNIYSGRFASVTLEQVRGKGSLTLRDGDPYDYARVFRVFRESRRISLSFSLLSESKSETRLEIDVMDRKGYRPVQLVCDMGSVRPATTSEKNNPLQIVLPEPDVWLDVMISIDASKGLFNVELDGRSVFENQKFGMEVASVERIEFRTGPYRMSDPLVFRPYDDVPTDHPDLPGADTPLPESIFHIGHLKAEDQE